jgi:hypothetical protein
LAVGELVRAVGPVLDDAEPFLVVLGQAGQRGVRSGEVGGAAVGQGEEHAGQQGAGFQLAAADGGRQHLLYFPGDAGAADDVLDHRQRDGHGRALSAGRAPSSATASRSVPGSRPAVMSPGCWQQVMPAACRNAGRPVSAAQPASQVARSREVSRGGRTPPPARERVSGLVMLPRSGSVPPVRKLPPANAAASSSR